MPDGPTLFGDLPIQKNPNPKGSKAKTPKPKTAPSCPPPATSPAPEPPKAVSDPPPKPASISTPRTEPPASVPDVEPKPTRPHRSWWWRYRFRIALLLIGTVFSTVVESVRDALKPAFAAIALALTQCTPDFDRIERKKPEQQLSAKEAPLPKDVPPEQPMQVAPAPKEAPSDTKSWVNGTKTDDYRQSEKSEKQRKK